MSFIASSQDFEGVITVKETHRANMIKKKIYVKGDMVRLETYLANEDNALKGVKLINLKSGEVTALLPARKLYLPMPDRSHDRPLEVKVEKTNEKKAILGKDCQKTVVRSEQRKVQVTFWIHKGNFAFYAPMMKATQKNNNVSKFFGKLEANESGSMPLLIEESRLDGTAVSTTEVTEIKPETIDDNMFVVPDDYTLEER
jgi:hypothetical protein